MWVGWATQGQTSPNRIRTKDTESLTHYALISTILVCSILKDPPPSFSLPDSSLLIFNLTPGLDHYVLDPALPQPQMPGQLLCITYLPVLLRTWLHISIILAECICIFWLPNRKVCSSSKIKYVLYICQDSFDGAPVPWVIIERQTFEKWGCFPYNLPIPS